MIKCQDLSGTYKCTVPVIEGETVREFSIRVLKILQPKFCGKTNPWAFSSKKFMSSVIDKDKPVVDFIANNFVYINTMMSPSQYAQAMGNLQEGTFIPDLTTCSICLEDFVFSMQTVKDKVTPLVNCGHRFHVRCLYKLAEFICPLCRVQISQEEIQDIKWIVEVQK
jgi:hypothetical protein